MKGNREMFEAWYAFAHSEAIHMLPNGQYSSLRCQHSWDAWQASDQREGYKLVPVEPTIAMVRAYYETPKPTAERCYKAMIGAAP